MIDRRRFLAAGGASLALPAFESLPGARRANPTRAVWLYFPNGVAEGSWTPRSHERTGRLQALHPTMRSLEPLRDDLLFVDGLHTPEGNGHGAGTATWLTGGEWDERQLSAGGASVDQIAARHVGRECVLPSLELSAEGEGFFAADLPRTHISWISAYRPAFRESDPRAVFQRMFGTSPEGDRSILDRMRNQARDLRRRLHQVDQQKLDEYLDAIRGVERRIAFAADDATRARLERAEAFGLRRPPAAIPESHGDYLDTLLDLVALALWTGATRVASVMLDHGQSNRYCPFVPGAKGTWHALSHWRDTSGKTEDDDGIHSWTSRAQKRRMYDNVVSWHHERVARFLTRLKALPLGGTNLLDQSVVVYGSSISDGHEHGDENLPILIAGKGGGAIRPGRQIRSDRNVSLSRVHLATLAALQVPEDRFAEAQTPMPWG